MKEVKKQGAMTYQDHKQASHHMLTFSSGIDTELGHAVLVKTDTASSPVP